MESNGTVESRLGPDTNGTVNGTGSMDLNPPNTTELSRNWAAPNEGPIPNAGSPTSFKELFLKHWHPTITYCAVFWSFGMCVAFLGPTLLDLGCQTASDMRTISWVFFAQLLCSLIGASLAGYLVERCDANYMILVSTTLIPISMFIIPFCHYLWALAIVLAVMGINMGMIDCLANLQMIKVYGEHVAPFLQAMHFCYGVAAFVSPMIAEPFLLNEDCSIFIDGNQTSGAAPGMLDPSLSATMNDTSLPAHSLYEAQHKTRVKYAFWIMAATMLPVPILVASLIVKLRQRGWTQHHQTLDESDASPASVPPSEGKMEYGTMASTKTLGTDGDKSRVACCKGIKSQVILITAGTSAMLFIYDGLQSAYGGYVYSYAVKSIINLNKTEGAYLNALFWGMFALGRLVSIPLATRLTPIFMLICNITGCLFSMTLMLGLRHDHVSMYIGTMLFGIFLSSVAPTALSLAEQCIDMSSTITSIIVVMAATGEMICPVIVGNIFVVYGPVSFLVFCEIMVILSTFVYVLLYFVGKNTPKSIAKGPKSFVWNRGVCLGSSAPEESPDVDQPVTKRVKYHQRFSEDSGSNIELTTVGNDSSDNHAKDYS